MSLSSIKSVVEQGVTTVEWRGVPVRMAKLRADDGMELANLDALPKDLEGKPATTEGVRKFFETLLKATVIEDDGSYSFRTPEGQTLLDRMSFVELSELGTMALEWSGVLGDSKKN